MMRRKAEYGLTATHHCLCQKPVSETLERFVNPFFDLALRGGTDFGGGS